MLYIKKILDLFKSIIVNFRYLPLKQAIKLPINVDYRVKFLKCGRGSIQIKGKIYHSMIRFGKIGFPAINSNISTIYIDEGSVLQLCGKTTFSEGVSLWLENKANLSVGRDFYCNKNCIFRITTNSSFGNNVLLGWNIMINTSDGHRVYINGVKSEEMGPVVLGNNVWIGSNSFLSKNTSVADGSIVAQCSLVNKQFLEKNILIGGIPAKQLKQNVIWVE